MSRNWIENSIANSIDGEHIIAKVKKSLGEYLGSKSLAFKRVANLLLEAYTSSNLDDIYQNLPEGNSAQDAADDFISQYNSDNGTNFTVFTPVFSSSGELFSLGEIISKIIMDPDGETALINPHRGLNSLKPDELMLDITNTLQKNAVLESAISVIGDVSISISDLAASLSLKFGDLHADAKSYALDVFSILSDSSSSFFGKISQLITPNINSVDGVYFDSDGLHFADFNSLDYTGITPFTAWQQSIDFDLSGPLSAVVTGVKAIGKALSWVSNMVGKGFSLLKKAVDDNVINSNDFRIANVASKDHFFDFPFLQYRLTSVSSSSFQDGSLFAKAEKYDRVMVNGDYKEIITNFGSILWNVDGDSLNLQIFLIPSSPFSLSNPDISRAPLPTLHLTSYYTNDVLTESKYALTSPFADHKAANLDGRHTLKVITEAMLKCEAIDLLTDHDDSYWYKSLMASMVRMELFIWLLSKHGTVMPSFWNWEASYFTSSDKVNMASSYFPFNYNASRFDRPTAESDYVFTSISLTKYYNLLDTAYNYEYKANPTNTDFYNLMSPALVTEITSPSLVYRSLIQAISELSCNNSVDGMTLSLSSYGYVLPFVPYTSRINTPDFRYSIATDSENGEIISKIFIGVVIVAAVVAAAYFGIKVRKSLRAKFVNVSAIQSGKCWDLSQLPPDSPDRAALVHDVLKLDRKLRKITRLSNLFGAGVTSIATTAIPSFTNPDGRISSILNDSNSSNTNIQALMTRIG